MDKDSTEYFLFTEILTFKGKKSFTTDLIWKDAYRNAKINGTLEVELAANEDILTKRITVAWSDLQRDLSGLNQHLHDAQYLGCPTLVTSCVAAYDGLKIPLGLEIVEVETLLDS